MTLSRHNAKKPMTLNQNAIGFGKWITMTGIIIIVLVASIWIFFNHQMNAEPRDTKLSNVMGITGQSQCLHPLTITVSRVNDSQFIVPILVIRHGESGTMRILYHLSASEVNHQGNEAILTETDAPRALSVSTATENKSKVGFSNGILIFRNANWTLYEYVVNTSSNSAGYYAILPPFYYGFYPSLAVTNQLNKLNNSALSMWGFRGIIQSGEFIIPSTIVGVTGFHVVNDTIPDISYCPNSACVLKARSIV